MERTRICIAIVFFSAADDRFMFPSVEKFNIQLFSPVNWEAIPNTRFELEEWEHATAMKNVMLASEGTMSGLKGYIAVATNYNYGEDVTSRGRVCYPGFLFVCVNRTKV